MVMTNIADIFASAARTRVLQVLYAQALPIHLRLIGTLCDCPIHSVELALAQLRKLGLVSRKKSKRQFVYELNRAHPSHSLLNDIFTAVNSHAIRERNQKLTKRASDFLPFLTEAASLIAAGRKSLHESR